MLVPGPLSPQDFDFIDLHQVRGPIAAAGAVNCRQTVRAAARRGCLSLEHGPTSMIRSKIFLGAALMLAASGAAIAQTAPKSESTRGELLYSTHCISCHNAQIHWRDKRLAQDWAGLKAQVRRWQSNVGLNWSDDEIVDVARRLNALYYHFPQTSDQVGLAPRPASRGP
jgi:mono/diheme cytochrome c family protein